MNLGAFSVSLAVKDLSASEKFYSALGFSRFHGDPEQGWLIMKSPTAVIGLFQGMFEQNILTFNPGWDSDAQPVDGFEDVRSIQKKLLDQGLSLDRQADESGTGPASLVVIDPDGNPVLIDQHV